MKILDKLVTADTGRRVALSPRISFVSQSEKYPAFNDAIQVQSLVAFSMDQIIRAASEIPFAHERAKKTLAREMYGEVVERLLDIRKKLWEAGPQYDDSITEAVDDLLRDLKP